MKIRTKLTFQFISIVALIFIFSSSAIYYFSAEYRKDDFYKRLQDKAENVAKLLIQVDEIDAELLRKIETDNPVSLPREKIIIYNYKNEILYTSDEARAIKIDINLLNKIRIERNIKFVQENFEIIGFLYTDKYDRFVVIAGAEDFYGVRRLANLLKIIIMVFCFALLIAFISGWIFSGRALLPISKVIKQVNEISILSLNLRVDEGNKKDEIAKLSQTFNNMLDRLEMAFHIQKNFIAKASHELRTPLHSISGQMEVALMKNRSNDEYKQIIFSVLDDMKNLNNISNRLLLLAQTSSENNKTDFSRIRIDEIIWQVQSEILKRNNNYNIAVNIDLSISDESGLIVLGNEMLLRTVLVNLIDNGCKYSNDNNVSIELKNDNNKIILIFSDKGIGIPQKDLPNIFEPFYRASNVAGIKGHGIGLSLVSSIMKLHNGTITIESQENIGTSFTVFFPKHNT